MEEDKKQSRTLRVVATISCIMVCTYASTVQLQGADFWLLAKIGEIIANQHSIPNTILFSFTEIADEKFNAHEWLSCLIFHYSIKEFGENGMPFVATFMGLILFALSSYMAYIRGGSNYAIGLCGGIFAVLVENYRHSIRPELISLVLMMVYWVLIEIYRKKPSTEIIVAALISVVVWVNCHGSFIMAPIISGIYLMGATIDGIIVNKKDPAREIELRKEIYRLIYINILTLLVCLINPFGWKLIEFVFRFSGDPALSKAIIEWHPTYLFFDEKRLWPIWAVWMATAYIVVLNIKKISATDALFFAAFTILSIKAIRFPVYLGMLSAYIIPKYLPINWQNASVKKEMYGGITFVALLLLCLAIRYGNIATAQPYSRGAWRLSSEMADILKNPKMEGNVYTGIETAPELIYLAYPRLKPSIDSRVDSYGFDYYSYQRALISNEVLFEEFVRRYNVKYILIRLNSMEQFIKLEAWKSGEWEDVLTDRTAVLLKRRDINQF